MLQIRDLEVEYGSIGTSVQVLRGVSVSVPEGSALAIVGESGSGKSTLALSVMRMISADAGRIRRGEIWLNGRDIVKNSAREMRGVLRNDIGFIPQDPTTALDPLFTIRSQIAEVLPRMSRAAADRRIVALLDSLGVVNAESRLRSYPHEFSGGMRQRVAVAIALAKEPRLLIADEPTTALDVTTQIAFLRLLDDLRTSRSLTTLFITHNLQVARLLCQNVAVMYAGVVVEAGPMAAVMEAPKHPYTQALLAVTTIDVAPQTPLGAIPGQPPSPVQDPVGCPFVNRCPRALGCCSSSLPGEVTTEVGVTYNCWNPVSA